MDPRRLLFEVYLPDDKATLGAAFPDHGVEEHAPKGTFFVSGEVEVTVLQGQLPKRQTLTEAFCPAFCSTSPPSPVTLLWVFLPPLPKAAWGHVLGFPLCFH